MQVAGPKPPRPTTSWTDAGPFDIDLGGASGLQFESGAGFQSELCSTVMIGKRCQPTHSRGDGEDGSDGQRAATENRERGLPMRLWLAGINAPDTGIFGFLVFGGTKFKTTNPQTSCGKGFRTIVISMPRALVSSDFRVWGNKVKLRII